MDSLFKFLLSSDTIFRKDACWVLANFCSYKSAATVVLRNQKIIEKLVELLYYDTVLEVRKEIAHIFNYIISLADEQLAFERIVSRSFL
jgi:flagellin-specific chaperone FliS